MEIRANYILVGFCTLLALFGMLASILWLSQSSGSEEAEIYEISFTESVSGLSIGNPVLFSGIKVGQVQEIKISETVPGAVKVLISIRGDTPVREDSEARLEMVGLTGSVAVAVSGGTSASPLMDLSSDQLGTIKTKPSSLSAVIKDMPDTMAIIKAVVGNMDDITNAGNRKSIETTLSSVAELTEALAGEKQLIALLIRDAQGGVKEFRELMALSNRVMGKLEKVVNDIGPELSSTTSETMPQLRVLITESRLLVNTLSRIGQKMENDPARFLFGNPIKEYQP